MVNVVAAILVVLLAVLVSYGVWTVSRTSPVRRHRERAAIWFRRGFDSRLPLCQYLT